jgi:DNA-binding response OmpR family regulator
VTVQVVDDEPTILETVSAKLRREGFDVLASASAEDALRLFREHKPDLILLDVMLPGRSGFDLCRTIRRESAVPVIFLTARSSETDRVAGFDLGADDYVVKPFNLAELAARVKAVLRRTSSLAAEKTVEAGDLVVDPRSHEVRLGDRSLPLPPRQFALLYFLVVNRGQAFSRETLLDRVWGADAFVTARTIDVHVRWLRQHIEQDPAHPRLLVTVRGLGYKYAG